MSAKRVELTEEERDLVVEALRFWKRRFQGRLNYARKAQHNLELQAQDWAGRLRMPNVAKMQRDRIPEWQQRETDTRHVKELAADLIGRFSAPDDPSEQFFSQEIVAAVKAGQFGLLTDKGEAWGALIPAAWYGVLKQVMTALKGWAGAWAVVRLPNSPNPPEEMKDEAQVVVGVAAEVASADQG